MQRVLVAMGRLVKDDEGQDLIEYGLVAVLIAVGAILTIGSLGTAVNRVFWEQIAHSI
jgi:Flp pilus assembly pilin Flp